MNIGRKLILSFLVVTLLPTILLALLTTTIISGSKREDAQKTINNNLRAAWMQYHARAYQMQYGMLQASTEEHIKRAIQTRDVRFLQGQIEAWKKYRPYVDLWAVVDPSGRAVATLTGGATGDVLALNGLTGKTLETGKSIISTESISFELLKKEELIGYALVGYSYADPETERVVEDVLTEGLMLVVTTPVLDDSGEVLGAILTGDLINNDPFVPDTLAERIPGVLATISMGGIQVATNVTDESGRRITGRVVPSAVLAEIDENRGFRGEAMIAREVYIAAFDPISNHRGEVIGSLFVGVPKSEFVKLQYENIKVIASIAMVGLFLATGAASFITYMVTKPIKSLTKKAQLVSTGDFNVRTGNLKEGDDEIADLARTFDIMVANLRENEEKLGQQKNLIESIINSLPYCLYVLDSNMSIVAWNRHVERVCPVCMRDAEADPTNENFIRHLPDFELRDGMEKVIESVFETGVPRHLEKRLHRASSGEKDVFLSISVFPVLSDKGGPVDYVVWMAEDVTGKKEMEASVISSEKLAAIGQLAAGVAHEVNNPIGGILNCLYNLKKRKLPDSRKEEYLEFMDDGLNRVQNIIKQLLDFSQQHDPELVLTDINEMIEGLVPLFLHTIKDRDIRLVRKLGQGLPSIRVDKHQVEQILVNIMLNAIYAVDGEGVIEITTRYEGNWYLIEVADNGCGIPRDNLPKIFDPFYTTKGVGEGTGLGLSVSRGIIERHNGRIDVASNAGDGTVFTVYLPLET